MRYAYQRNGTPLLSWKGGTAPQGTRAADAKALGAGLGSLGDPTLELPRAGAPEPLPALAGCACKGTTTGLIGQPMGDYLSDPIPGQYVEAAPLGGIVDTIRGLSLPVKIAGAIGIFFLWKKLAKRKYKKNPGRRRKRKRRPIHRRKLRPSSRARRRHARYSTRAKKFIAKRLADFSRGKMKSSSGRRVRNKRQALAVALSEARKKGYKVPRKR